MVETLPTRVFKSQQKISDHRFKKLFECEQIKYQENHTVMHCARRLKLTKRQLKSGEKRRLSFKENNDKTVLGLSIGNNGAQLNRLISLKDGKKITSNLTYT